MPKISQLTELAEDPADDDMLAIVDVSASRTKKIRADRLGGGGGAGGITESHFSVVDRDFGVTVPNDAGPNPFIQIGSVGYYGGYAGYVQDPNQVVAIVGSDFTFNNADYDDEHYGAFSLPVDVGGLFSLAITMNIDDVATSQGAISPAVSASFEVYTMPSFDTVLADAILGAASGSVGQQARIASSWTQWMMPAAGEQLYFGFWLQNNHATMDIAVYYTFVVNLLQRKEA